MLQIVRQFVIRLPIYIGIRVKLFSASSCKLTMLSDKYNTDVYNAMNKIEMLHILPEGVKDFPTCFALRFENWVEFCKVRGHKI